MADVSVIKLPNNTSLNVKDASAVGSLSFSGHTLTATKRDLTTADTDIGSFDTLEVDDLNVGNIVATGAARFANGVLGDVTGNASTATKLADTVTIQTNLASTTAANFDGSSNITPGITGTLAVGHGGTGQTSAQNAANAFIDALGAGTTPPKDGDTYIASYADGKNADHNGNNTYYRRPVTQLWAYIKDKADAVYATAAQGTLADNAMPKSGGTFTGAVTLNADPTANLHAATKQYVDTQLTNGIAASDAMVFKGTVGTGGTATSLPTSSVVVGDTYKAISAISIAAGSSWTGSAVSAKSGDLVVAMASTPKWIVVPSGDETVTTLKYSTTTQNLTTSAQSGAITVGEAATKQVVTSIDSTANLPTSSAVKTFVENKGYVTSSGVTSISAGVGLALESGNSITSTGTIKANLKSGTYATNDSVTITDTANRQYAVVADKSGYLSVNVPWDGATYSNGTGITITNKTINHSNSVTAQNTQAIYPIAIDAQGHITSYGTAVTPLTSHQTIKQDGITGATVNRFGTSSTAAGTAQKEVSVTTGTYSLEAGARVSVKFTNANTANSPTLKVGGTAAKNIYHSGTQITTGDDKYLLKGVCDFIYDGTQYHLLGYSSFAASTITVGSASAWSAGTIPTLSSSDVTIPNVTSVGAAPTLTKTDVTIPNIATLGTAASMTKSNVTIPNVTGVGTVPSLTITSTACDDITGWTTNTPTTPMSAAVAGGTLSLTAGTTGTAASLSYTARSVGSASGWSAGSTPTLGTALTATYISAWNGGSAPTLGDPISATHIDSWNAGAAPTLGTALSASKISAWNAGTAPSLTINNRDVVHELTGSSTVTYTMAQGGAY